MKFSYKFSNLLGTVYRKGNLLFTPDGNSVISAVGNRISIFDIRNNKSNTLPIESQYNYVTLDLSPNGCILIAINEEGEAHMISLVSQTVVHRYRFKGKCRAIKFSPNGKHFAVCKDNNVFVFKAPGPFSGEYNAFVMERVFHGAYNETTCLDWSSDSRILAVGSKDMATKLYPLEKWANFRICSLGNHTDGIVGCFFEKNSYDMLTISRNGQVCVWESSIDFEELVPKAPRAKKTKVDDDTEDDIDVTKSLERTQADVEKELNSLPVSDVDKESSKLVYKRICRHYLADEVRNNDKNAALTVAAYHKETHFLIIGFSTGAFFIYEAPDMNLIHSLSVSEQKITSIAVNQTGDWIALGCSGLGQLLVWEWQSETHIMKQQGHANTMTTVSYSGDGQILATGGHDGKVKLWNVFSGFCFVTFAEHSSAITAVAFSTNRKFVVSSSLDGTVRAFDIVRYRNFKTFTAPRSVQFSCVCVDGSGEFVAAGGQDVFEIYLWAVQTGKLLEVLTGHEGPVASLAFSSSLTNTTMVSVSWDKTLRVWDAIERGSSHETIELLADGLFVAFHPNGLEAAVATLDGHITVFNVKTATQLMSIEGRNDLGSGRSDTDLVTAKKNLDAKAFTSLCYSADGDYLLAGGQSKNVCIYNVKEALLVKKFEITQNRSLDAVDDFINRRKMTEYGNMALVEEREEREGGNVSIKLPGVREGDMASRAFKPEVRVLSLQFCPTGQQWAAATTEGLLIYALNSGLVFDPWDLQIGITPKAVRQALTDEDYLNALMMAIKINETDLILEVTETIPVKDIELVVSSLQEHYVVRLLDVAANRLENSRHLEYYLEWMKSILTVHGSRINGKRHGPALLAVEKSLIHKNEAISKLCNFNTYTSKYIMSLGRAKEEKALKAESSDLSEDDDDKGLDFDNIEDDSASDLELLYDEIMDEE